MHRPPSSLLPFFFLLSLALSSFASKGDRNPVFKRCVKNCEISQCAVSPSLPLSLQLTRWTCSDLCKYDCMHAITSLDVGSGADIQQYYGKWPFWRLGGVQEPASVAFSLLNLWGHARGMRRIRREVRAGHPMKRYYYLWAIASMNTWVWSSVFHCRDTPSTEKMDYFSAAATILFGLYMSVVRLFHLYHTRFVLSLWSTTCVVALVSHISYLSLLTRFDYTYNIISNSVVGLTHNFLWILYALPSFMSVIQRFPSRPKNYRPPFVNMAMYLVLFTTAATGLELFDFPPIARVIDAHSLWHLATAVVAPVWYDFLVRDSSDAGWTINSGKYE